MPLAQVQETRNRFFPPPNTLKNPENDPYENDPPGNPAEMTLRMKSLDPLHPPPLVIGGKMRRNQEACNLVPAEKMSSHARGTWLN
jgi:hypothetical protein